MLHVQMQISHEIVLKRCDIYPSVQWVPAIKADLPTQEGVIACLLTKSMT